jgi:hypothetical protein
MNWINENCISGATYINEPWCSISKNLSHEIDMMEMKLYKHTERIAF